MLGVLQEGMPGVQKDEALSLKKYVGCFFYFLFYPSAVDWMEADLILQLIVERKDLS